jgi:septum formation protein
MSAPNWRFILASRSPRRLELLSRLVPADQIIVRPPRSADEPGFDDCRTEQAIERRLREIARAKCDDVLSQINSDASLVGDPDSAIVIAADTTIIATGANGEAVVLGQPPEEDERQETVRRWFREYYFGRVHHAATALCVAVPTAKRLERTAVSRVAFHADGKRWLDWYLATGEPRGKAGGYAIQGLGEIFVERVEGSISNVIGLPLRELVEMLEEVGVHPDSGSRFLSGT